ncbi:MAG: sulfurtransferase-like selenium metabolism protein YedF [Firmicutes bacterium]|nr:sulfurtransferase-like selenium metabolism protein YedF [Bacillota bacterium]
MNTVIVNAIGDTCPIPVIKTKKALAAMTEPGMLEVHVDNETAVSNLTRFATSNSCKVESEKLEEKHFVLHITAETPVKPVINYGEIVCDTAAAPNQVICVTSDKMGLGDDTLGANLMKAFFFAVTQQDMLPRTILFYNGGAKLTVEGSPVLEDLKKLAEEGVDILTCGTCLNFYGIADKLAVGDVTNMYDIVEKLSAASNVIRP